MAPEEAVVVCTRNRPTELAHTLESVAEQSGAAERLVMVVDGSDQDEASRTADVVHNRRDDGLPVRYHRYTGTPAGTCSPNRLTLFTSSTTT